MKTPSLGLSPLVPTIVSCKKMVPLARSRVAKNALDCAEFNRIIAIRSVSRAVIPEMKKFYVAELKSMKVSPVVAGVKVAESMMSLAIIFGDHSFPTAANK
jgi:hypothetical protein